MYFYVDESGNTGNNLFDLSQPTLCYGVLSSRVNLDLLAFPYLRALKEKTKVECLHAVTLNEEQWVLVAPVVLNLCKKYQLTFDFFRVVKADYALICFFDQVFDSGVNPAVSWLTYYTPLRYSMLFKLAKLFDDETLKKAWAARIESNSEKAEKQLIEVCQIIKDRVSQLSDEKLIEVVSDALQWVQDNPSAISYNASSGSDKLQISPNLIGFQFVLRDIALRLLKKKKGASKIVVDQQCQFNKAQQTLADLYLKFPSDQIIKMGIDLPSIDMRGMPTIPITPTASGKSPGLELTDIFLRIFMRVSGDRPLPEAAMPIVNSQIYRGNMDGISLSAISKKWAQYFQERRDRKDVSEEDIKAAQ